PQCNQRRCTSRRTLHTLANPTGRCPQGCLGACRGNPRPSPGEERTNPLECLSAVSSLLSTPSDPRETRWKARQECKMLPLDCQIRPAIRKFAPARRSCVNPPEGTEMNKTLLVVLLAILTIMFLGAAEPALAHRGGHGGGGFHGGGGGFHAGGRSAERRVGETVIASCET